MDKGLNENKKKINEGPIMQQAGIEMMDEPITTTAVEKPVQTVPAKEEKKKPNVRELKNKLLVKVDKLQKQAAEEKDKDKKDKIFQKIAKINSEIEEIEDGSYTGDALNEQDPDEEMPKAGEEPKEVKDAPAEGTPPSDEKKPEEEPAKEELPKPKEEPVEYKKEYYGSKGGDKHFYFVHKQNEETGVVEDLQILDIDDKTVISAKEKNLDITDEAAFLKAVAPAVGIDMVAYDIVTKYDLLGLEPKEEEKPKEEKSIEEPKEEKPEVPAEEEEEAPEEEEVKDSVVTESSLSFDTTPEYTEHQFQVYLNSEGYKTVTIKSMKIGKIKVTGDIEELKRLKANVGGTLREATIDIPGQTPPLKTEAKESIEHLHRKYIDESVLSVEQLHEKYIGEPTESKKAGDNMEFKGLYERVMGEEVVDKKEMEKANKEQLKDEKENLKGDALADKKVIEVGEPQNQITTLVTKEEEDMKKEAVKEAKETTVKEKVADMFKFLEETWAKFGGKPDALTQLAEKFKIAPEMAAAVISVAEYYNGKLAEGVIEVTPVPAQVGPVPVIQTAAPIAEPAPMVAPVEAVMAPPPAPFAMEGKLPASMKDKEDDIKKVLTETEVSAVATKPVGDPTTTEKPEEVGKIKSGKEEKGDIDKQVVDPNNPKMAEAVAEIKDKDELEKKAKEEAKPVEEEAQSGKAPDEVADKDALAKKAKEEAKPIKEDVEVKIETDKQDIQVTSVEDGGVQTTVVDKETEKEASSEIPAEELGKEGEVEAVEESAISESVDRLMTIYEKGKRL